MNDGEQNTKDESDAQKLLWKEALLENIELDDIEIGHLPI